MSKMEDDLLSRIKWKAGEKIERELRERKKEHAEIEHSHSEQGFW